MNAKEVEREINEMIAEGLCKIVTLDIFKSVEQLKLTDFTKEQLEETFNNYKDYLKRINDLPEDIKLAFLEMMKENEVIHNHQAENEDKFLLHLNRILTKHNSIDIGTMMLEDETLNGNLTKEDMQTLHQVLLEGTSSNGPDCYKLREGNTKFVGGFINGTKWVDYIPMKDKDLPIAMDLVSEYLNKDSTNPLDTLSIPIVAHGLIAAIQAFDDGNTRLARLIQHLKIWHLSKKFNLTYINSPALYMSKSYYISRKDYRDNITKIVDYLNDEAWNRWFRYNLSMMDEQLFFGNQNLDKIEDKLR